MKILYLGFPNDQTKTTGGHIVDLRYKEILNKDKRFECYYKDFGEVGISSRFLNGSQVNDVIEELNKYDVVIFDARGFTLFIFIIKKMI